MHRGTKPLIKLSLQSLSYRDTFNDGQIDLEGIIERAAELRLEGVDLHFRHFASTDDDYLEDIRLLCLNRGLHMCYIGISNDFLKPNAEGKAQVQLVKDWIDVAARMGIQMVRVFGGSIPDGETFDSMYPRLLANTREAVAYGRSKGVVCGLHNHNHRAGPATGEQVLRLLDDVDDPYYSHILDTGQYKGSPGASRGERGQEAEEWGFYESIQASAPRTVQVRAKLYRIASGSEAWLDYDRIMPILKNVGFNGWMSLVFEGQDELDEPTAVPIGVRFLRGLLEQYKV